MTIACERCVWYFLLMLVLTTRCIQSDDYHSEEKHQQNEQDTQLDPVAQGQDDTSQRDHDKRTLYSYPNYGWAKHVTFRNGAKHVLGYAPVDLKFVPVIKPVQHRPWKTTYFRPRPRPTAGWARPVAPSAVPWPLPSPHPAPVKPVYNPWPVKPVYNDWMPVLNPPAVQQPLPTVPAVTTLHPVPAYPTHPVPVHIPAPIPTQPIHAVQPTLPALPPHHHHYHPAPVYPVQSPVPTHPLPSPADYYWYQLLQQAKQHLPVLPLGATFLSPVLQPQHQHHPHHHDAYAPQAHIHAHVAVEPDVHEHVVHDSHVHHVLPEHVHVSEPDAHAHLHAHAHVGAEVVAAPLHPYAASIEYHGKHAQHLIPQPHPTPVIPTKGPHPYVASVEFYGATPPNAVYNYHAHDINAQHQTSDYDQHYQEYSAGSLQPGHTDVQLPVHLPEHPNYRPEDYYYRQNAQYEDGQYGVASKRNDGGGSGEYEEGSEENRSSGESEERERKFDDFRPSQLLYEGVEK